MGPQTPGVLPSALDEPGCSQTHASAKVYGLFQNNEAIAFWT